MAILTNYATLKIVDKPLNSISIRRLGHWQVIHFKSQLCISTECLLDQKRESRELCLQKIPCSRWWWESIFIGNQMDAGYDLPSHPLLRTWDIISIFEASKWVHIGCKNYLRFFKGNLPLTRGILIPKEPKDRKEHANNRRHHHMDLRWAHAQVQEDVILKI